MRQEVIAIILTAIVVASLTYLVTSLYLVSSQTSVVPMSTAQTQEVNKTSLKKLTPPNITGNNTIVVEVPAVDQKGNGVPAYIAVEIKPGKGRVLVDIGSILSYYDTQNSARVAVKVAENFTGKSLENYDVIFSFKAPAPVVEGGSAGAAMCAAVIALLEDKKIRDDVMITGTINMDGTIGPVAGILAKAKVAKDENKTTFLVPLGQSRQVEYKEKKSCYGHGNWEFCYTEYTPVEVNIGEKLGLNVTEVKTIEDVVKYMLT